VPLGCAKLGSLLVQGLGVGKDEARAATLFTATCDDGGLHGCADLGLLYDSGIGVAQNDARAAPSTPGLGGVRRGGGR
jgi:uncharacterized protein